MTISTALKRVVQVGTGSTNVFYFNGVVQGVNDLAVYTVITATGVQTLQTRGGAGTYDYTLTINPATKFATITLNNNLPSTHKIVILRGIALTQVVDYVEGDPFAAETHEDALDKLTLIAAQLQEQLDRSVKVVETSTTTDIKIQELVADKLLIVDSAGSKINMGPTLADVDTVAANIADVNTIADNIADINTVADDLNEPTSEIHTVATSIVYVDAVGAKIGDVETVSTNIADVETVADNLNGANTIGAVAAIDADISTVAGIAADVTAVANNEVDISQVATDIAKVIEVANDLQEATSEIDTVANSIANVDTVGTNIANVNTVAGIAANVTTVAGIAANVTTVAGISADVSTVAADGTDIGTVAGIAANVTTVAGIAANVTTVAGIAANVTTVAGISSDVTTVATNVADITNFADVYQGGKSSNPSTRNDSSPLQVGDLYFNTVGNELRIYDGSAWLAGVTSSGGLVLKAGDTMTGPLILSGDPSTALGAATKQYVDAIPNPVAMALIFGG